jgi:nucleotide-binding universal stress UspA family protein
VLRSILLALDGIADGTAAVDVAVTLAVRHSAAVDLRLTLDRAAIAERGPVGIGGASRAAHRERVIAERLAGRLEQAERAALERLAGTGVEARPDRLDSDVRAELPRLAVEHDLVILSNALRRRADSDDLDLAFSLPVEDLVRATGRPFLLVDSRPLGDGPVLAAFDGGRSATRALQLAALLGLVGGRAARVVTVGPSREEAEATARRAARFLERHGAAAAAEGVASDGDHAEALAERVAALAPAMLVMGAFGERALGERLFGSTTRALLARAEPPLFVQA